MVKIKIKRIHPKAKKPKLATPGSACFDLFACEDVLLTEKSFVRVKTGLIFEIPKGFFVEVRPRSGLSAKGVIIPNAPGTIDSDYRGEIVVLMYGLFINRLVQIKAGDRVAQCRIVRGLPAKFVFVDEVSETDRGSGGFGSTGK